MPVEYKIQNAGNGQVGNIKTPEIVSQLQEAGYNPQGMSADGTKITLHDDQGPYEVPVHEALKGLGWQVKGATPSDADYDNVQPAWRAAVHKLPDDESREAYIKGQMAKLGQPDAQVMGQGRDWHVFNPKTSQWVGVTNSPDWDKSDLVEAGLEIPRMAASALGGAGGALAGEGVASIPGAMAGAALGGGAIDTAERGLLAARDPVYRQVAGDRMGAMAKDVGFNAALDGATAGVFKGAPMLAKGLLGKTAGAATEGILNNGVVSTAARAAGKTAEMGGGAVRGLAKMADREAGHDVMASMIPGAAEGQTLGLGMRAPAWLSSKAADLAGRAGESKTMNAMAPDASANLRQLMREMTRKNTVLPSVGDQAEEQIGKFADTMAGGTKAPASARAAFDTKPSTLYANLGRSIGRNSYDVLKGGAEDASLPAWHAWGSKGASMGQKFGKGLEDLDKLGQGVERTANAVGKSVIKGARYGGQGVQYGGKALKNAGRLGQPLENRALLRYGAEEAYRPDFEQASSSRKKKPQAMMGTELVQN